MTDRPLKVGEMIKRALSAILYETVLDVSLDSASLIVSEVQMTPDLKRATVYVFPTTGISTQRVDQVLKTLQQCSSKLTALLCQRVLLRSAPVLVFKLDQTFDNASKINNIISR
jgi:ribosome-binding factor A